MVTLVYPLGGVASNRFDDTLVRYQAGSIIVVDPKTFGKRFLEPRSSTRERRTSYRGSPPLTTRPLRCRRDKVGGRTLYRGTLSLVTVNEPPPRDV